MPSRASSSVLTIREGSWPLHMAGRVRTLSKSLMQALRRLISPAVWSISPSIVRCAMGVLVPRSAALAYHSQELIRRDEEWVLLEDSADDDHRMGPHDVDHDLPAKLGEIVDSYDRIFIPRQYVVQPCLVLHEIINAWAVLQGPFHVGDEACQREALLSAVLQHLLDQSQHPVLIEVAIPQICIGPVAQFELPALFCGCHIDAGRRQSAQVFLTELRVYDVEGLLAAVESLLDER